MNDRPDPITSSPLPDRLQLSPEDVSQRKEFLEFTEADVVLLKKLHELFDGHTSFLVDDFYRHLLKFDEMRQLIQGDAHLSRLKQTQAAYFDQLTAGNYDETYIQNRIGVGAAHQRVGLPLKWYIGAYSKYLALLLPRVWDLLKVDDRKTLETTLALLKIIYLDMGIAIDTYIDAEQQAAISKSRQLDALNHIAIAITSSLGLQEVMERIMHSGITLTSSTAACVAFYNEESKRFEEWYTQGLSDHFVKNMSFRSGGMAIEAFTTGSYIVSNDRAETSHKLSALAHSEGILGFVCLPLISQSHHLGLLYLYRNDRDTFSSQELGLFTTFANLAAGALENARLHSKALSLASLDTLTGLFNRRIFDERLNTEMQRSLRYSLSFSLLMLDIDNFKKINDTYGHSSGDAVLKQLALLLREHVRDVDTVARYGGEEFTIIAPESEGNEATLTGERIRKSIASFPFIIPDGTKISVTVSIGISCHPHGANDTKTMIDQADEALYLAKQGGRNQVCIYSPSAMKPGLPPTHPG